MTTPFDISSHDIGVMIIGILLTSILSSVFKKLNPLLQPNRIRARLKVRKAKREQEVIDILQGTGDSLQIHLATLIGTLVSMSIVLSTLLLMILLFQFAIDNPYNPSFIKNIFSAAQILCSIVAALVLSNAGDAMTVLSKANDARIKGIGRKTGKHQDIMIDQA